MGRKRRVWGDGRKKDRIGDRPFDFCSFEVISTILNITLLSERRAEIRGKKKLDVLCSVFQLLLLVSLFCVHSIVSDPVGLA